MLSNASAKTISEALEEYLEAIYSLSLERPEVRITDVSLKLGLSKPSVNRAVNALKNAGLVYHEPYGDVILTPYGEQKGKECHQKHNAIARFFSEVLNMTKEAAEKEACKIEHSLSLDTIDKMENYMQIGGF